MRSLVLIDLSHIFRSAWHASADEAMSTAYTKTLEKVHGIASAYELVAVCCDHPPYKRKEVFADYKANREKQPDAMHEQFRRTKDRLIADGFLLWSVPGFEADDVIATAVDYARREEESLAITIASNDKDLMQLVSDGDNVRFFSTATGEILDEAAVLAKWGVLPSKLLDSLSLQGDSSDNVPGIPKVGPKTAANLLSEFGDVEGVLANHSRIKQPKLAEAVRQHADAVRLAKRLIALSADVPLAFDDVFVPRAPKQLTAGGLEADSEETGDGFSDDDAAVAHFDQATEKTPPPTSAPQAKSEPAQRAPSSPPPSNEGFEGGTAPSSAIVV
jgi:DNA polymerase-1